MKPFTLVLGICCIIQSSPFVTCDSNEDSSNSMSPMASTTFVPDLQGANSGNDEDAPFIKNCSEAKTISKRETDRLSQVDDDKLDSSNNDSGDSSPKRNSSVDLHKTPFKFSEKDGTNTNENGDMPTTTANSVEDNSSSEGGSSTNIPLEEDIIILPLPPRPIFIELIFFRTNRTSSESNGTSIGKSANMDFSSEDISTSSPAREGNETGSNLPRSSPHGSGLSDMKGSLERDETTGLEHVRLVNSKTSTSTTTMQTTASLDDGNNEDALLRSTRNLDNFNSVESSSAIPAKTSSHLAQKITRLSSPSTPTSPSDIGGQGHKGINSDEDADTNSGSGTHMPVTISESELRGKSNGGERESSTTAPNRRRRDTIFSHLTNNSQAGSSQDGKASSEKKLMVATSTPPQESNKTNTDSNLPDVAAGESLEVIVSGSRSDSTTPENKGIIAAFMEILGLGGVRMDDNPANSTNNATTISPSNSNQNSTSGFSGQARRFPRAANGPNGNSNSSSSPSSTPSPVSSTSSPAGKATPFPPLLDVPSAGTNGTKFPKKQPN